MERYYKTHIQRYQDKKITLISGPRQSGKTTLSKMLCSKNEYLNFDLEEDREIIMQKSWNRNIDQIILDEVHKMKDWKRWIKGIYDTEKIPPKITITGSAKLDTFKKVGDSLAGRYFQYRVHPLDIRELYHLDKQIDLADALEKLSEFSGFPEPYLAGERSFYNKWKKSHLDVILRHDLISQEDVRDLTSIEILIQLLQKRIGSPISYLSLANDLRCSDKTVKRWLQILENMFIVFKVTPFHKNIARSNLKKPKYYFYDNARVKGDEGAKLENLVANSLLKECHYRQDCLGEDYDLFYLSKKGGIEIDFAISENEKLKYMIEVKNSDDHLSKNIKAFKKDLPHTHAIQIVKNLRKEKTYKDVAEIRHLANWLCVWE